jgi:hypothetical protein
MDNNKQLPNGQNTTPVNQNGEGEYQIILPCDVKNFRGFVAGLLGKPKETKGEIEGTFELSPLEISNICHLITQRVSRQNDSSLINLVITVHYDDGDSVSHHNIQDFENYHPSTSCTPVGISLDFTYLIKFQGKDVHEKQEINVSIETDAEWGHKRIKRWFRSGLFMFSILHTERTWASDIAGLIRGYATGLIKKPSSVRTFIFKHDTELITYLCITVFTLVSIFWCLHTLNILSTTAGEQTQYDLTRYWVSSITIFIVLGALLFSVNNFFQFHVVLREESHITLTDSDKKRIDKRKKSLLKNWIIYIFGWIFNISAGIISTLMFNQFF